MNQQLVDIITQRVLQQLNGKTPSVAALTNALFIDQAVVTENTVAELINGHRSVQFGQKTVLTPSAREFLRRQNIDWSRGTQSDKSCHSKQKWQAIIVEHSGIFTAALSGMNISTATSPDTTASVAESVSAICRADADGIVLTVAHPQRTACLANRNRSIRAAAVATDAHIEVIVADMLPNLVCLNPKQFSVSQLRHIIRALTSNSPSVPANWQEAI